MNRTCYIIDDEPLAIEVIKRLAARHGGLEIAGTFRNALEAFQALKTTTVDLLFLDIRMPGPSGLDLLRSLKKPPLTILTTAHREHGVEGFDLDVADYLVKPISFERFEQAMRKVDRLLRTPPGSAKRPGNVLSVRIGHRAVRIPHEDILFIESRRDYVDIHTTDDTYRPLYRIGDLAEELKPHGFLRIHRSYVVPIDRIDAWTRSEIEIDGRTLPVGRTYRKAVLTALEAA